ncbi:hypothetical protein [Cryobacterium tagatosivorans]|uniref:XRE family transcriptional regulator n=1 Tax=Cryobacterium tagatosivorans TaxID=1259199 RepID=A0A4R8UI32_9MICO|nr:hypothetical protein [Cryobacterium tagatosivorans]TFB56756.1 hypothetical protein E3O23_00630 [Cryobacterium tagatosivorans]
MAESIDDLRCPRDLTEEPDGFGRVRALPWKTAVSRESEAFLLVAQRQHTYSVRIRRRIKETGSNLKAYAREAGTSYDRLGKLLRGVIVMRLEDIAMADVVLGGISEARDYQP